MTLLFSETTGGFALKGVTSAQAKSSKVNIPTAIEIENKPIGFRFARAYEYAGTNYVVCDFLFEHDGKYLYGVKEVPEVQFVKMTQNAHTKGESFIITEKGAFSPCKGSQFWQKKSKVLFGFDDQENMFLTSSTEELPFAKLVKVGDIIEGAGSKAALYLGTVVTGDLDTWNKVTPLTRHIIINDNSKFVAYTTQEFNKNFYPTRKSDVERAERVINRYKEYSDQDILNQVNKDFAKNGTKEHFGKQVANLGPRTYNMLYLQGWPQTKKQYKSLMADGIKPTTIINSKGQFNKLSMSRELNI